MHATGVATVAATAVAATTGNLEERLERLGTFGQRVADKGSTLSGRPSRPAEVGPVQGRRVAADI